MSCILFTANISDGEIFMMQLEILVMRACAELYSVAVMKLDVTNPHKSDIKNETSVHTNIIYCTTIFKSTQEMQQRKED